jgi:hypothetical protein
MDDQTPQMPHAWDFKILPYTNSELDPILNDIDRLFGFGFYYAAIVLSLTVPDICSSLETRVDDEARRHIETRYKQWCEKYLQPKFSVFTAKDCWALRGGVLHNGKLHGHTKLAYDRVIFSPPFGPMIHECVAKDNRAGPDHTLTLNVHRFLFNMVEAAKAWHRENGDNPIVQENIGGLVRTRMDGYPGTIKGAPVIA